MTGDVPVRSLVWTDGGSSFAVGEADGIRIRDLDSGTVRASLPVHDAGAVGFAKEFGRSGTLYATLSDSGELSVWDVGEGEAVPADIAFIEDPLDGTVVPIGQLRFTALAFSRNSDCMVAGMQDGSLRLFFKLRFSKQFLMRETGGQTGRITALAFSPDGRSFASASDDGSVLLVNAFSVKPVARLPFYAVEADGPIDFAPDGTLAAVLDNRSVVFYGRDGEQKGSLIVDCDIQAVRFWGGGDSLAVQGMDGSISFYNIASGERFASVPPVQASTLCSFDFSEDGLSLLEGYGDGTVYCFPLADYLAPAEPEENAEDPVQTGIAAAPEEPPAVPEEAQVAPVAEEPPAVPVAEEPFEYDDFEPYGEEEEDVEPRKRTFKENFTSTGRNSISLQAGGRLLQDPYDAAVELDLSFRMGTLFPPFYVGAALSGQLGKCFDADNYPNSYTWKGEDLAPPLTEAATLYVPLGVEFAIRNSAFSVFSELHGGVREVMLWRTCDEGLLRSKPHFVPMAGIYMGALFHGFMLQAGVDFDPVQRFTPGVLLGYSFTLPGGGKN
ncbi:MAG: WD40 repeat domain-containing protein [Treponema sp.]|nr:WD40 repeat domain-containing protein [Treponema sp.]